ncbi:Cyclin-dependent kinase inhibitor 2 [Triticum urartu]|uniref:Cyclin-dependent kinase inhibitor 2 n=1 Tax=Triticum urartu TaxID=4572 RepID=M7YP73_TRIUA|nr:Cyclin-dependent kinase inhibitor 2 [Triticum urartu]
MAFAGARCFFAKTFQNLFVRPPVRVAFGSSQEGVAIEHWAVCAGNMSAFSFDPGDNTWGACESGDVESSVSDSECGGRDRRETTPSSRSPADLSDLESSQAADEQKHKRRRYPATTTTTAAPFRLDLEARARMPPAAEIDEFFAAAEKAQAERFAANRSIAVTDAATLSLVLSLPHCRYNFDVARGVPLNAGRFEWTPVATV